MIATPNSSHVPLGLAALEAGLAVVVDKPLALNAAEGGRLVDAAAERGLMLTAFQNRRWDGDFLTLRRLLDANELGRVHRFESRFERWRPELGGGWRERVPPEEGGGLLLDLGSHLVDQAVQLFGPVRGLHAEVDARREGAVADDDVFLALEHESGVHSHLWASVLAAAPGPRFRVLGDRAAYVKDGLDAQEEHLRAGRSPSDPDWGRSRESAGADSSSARSSAKCRRSRARTDRSTPAWRGASRRSARRRSTRSTRSPRSRCSTPPASARGLRVPRA